MPYIWKGLFNSGFQRKHLMTKIPTGQGLIHVRFSPFNLIMYLEGHIDTDSFSSILSLLFRKKTWYAQHILRKSAIRLCCVLEKQRICYDTISNDFPQSVQYSWCTTMFLQELWSNWTKANATKWFERKVLVTYIGSRERQKF